MKHNKSILKNTTVVDFKQDAAFFVERGTRLLNRYDYEKALRSFRRAIELEPANAECHCHLASALAETGQFEASNDVLYEVIEKWDASMSEVYFYMANNYANLEDYQMAEEMAIRYLQEDNNGPYREDAEELLDYIYFELDMPPRHFPSDKEDVYSKHERARRSLEEGRFLEALDILKEIVETDPSFLPAWNNLSLAYYYVGDFQQSMGTIEKTLEMEQGNLHALCNLAVLLSHHNHTAELLSLMDMLKKVVPFHPENTYKLATTMGVLGQHDEAYGHYQRMLKSTGRPHEACTYHYAAISAYLSGRKDQALRWWQKAKQMDPEAGVADQYIQMVKNEQEGETIKPIPYQYNPPQKEVSWEKASFAGVENFKADPMIRASLLWALQHGRDEVKFAVLQTLSLIGDDEAETAVRQFYHSTDNQQLQKLALLALADMGAAMPENAPKFAAGSSADKQGVESVEEAIHLYIIKDGRVAAGNWCLRFWQEQGEFAKSQVQVRKALAWVAALEYVYGTVTEEKQSQAYLAQKYGVSVPTVAKCVKVLTMLDPK